MVEPGAADPPAYLTGSAQTASAMAGYQDMLGNEVGADEIVDNNDGNRGARPQ